MTTTNYIATWSREVHGMHCRSRGQEVRIVSRFGTRVSYPSHHGVLAVVRGAEELLPHRQILRGICRRVFENYFFRKPFILSSLICVIVEVSRWREHNPSQFIVRKQRSGDGDRQNRPPCTIETKNLNILGAGNHSEFTSADVLTCKANEVVIKGMM